MSLTAISCKNCGGAVRVVVGERLPSCLFCGSPALEETTVDPVIEPPEQVIDFQVHEAAAQETFKKFATSSFWYPSDLRRAALELNRLHLPAWTWSGTVVSHYAALIKASSASGKRPVTGKERTHMSGILVPSSTAIRRAELAAISPFDTADERPFDPETAEEPYELGRLTRSAARAAAQASLQTRHQAHIAKTIGAVRIRTACMFSDLTGRPLLVPVYIGAYRRKGKLYRVVINAQTGRLTGEAPTSWLKVALAVLVGLAAVAAVVLFILTLLGGGIGALWVM